MPTSHPTPQIPILLASREHQPETTLVRVGNAVFGGDEIVLVAGPCAVESREQLVTVARTLVDLGIPCLRGGAFKPRTSPYSFQGLGEKGLVLLGEVREQFGLSIITEVMTEAQIELAAPHVDAYQVGSRNMQNFELLKALSTQEKPVILKRGYAATLKELMMSAEYLLAGGNNQVILCERGIRGFDPETRNVLDLGGAAALKQMTHLPVIVDPSHATGRRDLVLPAARAAVAIGVDGIMVEAHPAPDESLSDAEQAISLGDLSQCYEELSRVAAAIGRKLLVSHSHIDKGHLATSAKA